MRCGAISDVVLEFVLYSRDIYKLHIHGFLSDTASRCQLGELWFDYAVVDADVGMDHLLYRVSIFVVYFQTPRHQHDESWFDYAVVDAKV